MLFVGLIIHSTYCNASFFVTTAAVFQLKRDLSFTILTKSRDFVVEGYMDISY